MGFKNKFYIVGEAMQGYIPVVVETCNTFYYNAGWPLRRGLKWYWAPGIRTYLRSVIEKRAFTQKYFQNNYLEASESGIETDLKSRGRLVRLLSLRFPNLVKERDSFFCRFVRDSRAYEIEVGCNGLDIKVECYERYRNVMKGEKLSVLTLIKKAIKEKKPYTWGLAEEPISSNSYFKVMVRLADQRTAAIASRRFKAISIVNTPKVKFPKFHKFSNSRNRKDFRLLKHFVAFLKQSFIHNAENLKLFP